MRYLVVTLFNVEKGVEVFRQYRDWRHQIRIDTIIDLVDPAREARFNELYQHTVHGVDRGG